MKNRTLADFCAMSASYAPVPGGGGVSAAIGALSAALGEMVTNLTIGKKKYLQYNEELETIRKELSDLREKLLDCINRDAEAFKPLAEAYKIPKEDPEYSCRMEKCLKTAADSPFQILKLACRIIELDDRLSVIGSKLSVSDAATSVMLAHGVLYGAYINIIVNTNLMEDRYYAIALENEAQILLNKYSEKALRIFDAIKTRLNNG